MAQQKLLADPAALPRIASYTLMVGAIVPRPIGFLSTLSREGIANLAPFSFFNAICADPPAVCVSISNRVPPKDTIANIRATGEFVVNVVTEAIAQQMNLCSADHPPAVSEFDISGLTREPSDLVKPPCVLESPVNMECRVMQIVEVSTRPGGATLVIGEIVRFHYDPSVMAGGTGPARPSKWKGNMPGPAAPGSVVPPDSLGAARIDPRKLRAVGRMGGNEYTRTKDRFEMTRPEI